MKNHHGITTTHRGIEFRSRLEAKWAAFFTRIGWKWTYEPFDGDGYIPDFLIHGDSPILVEVKPAVTRRDYVAPIPKMEHGLDDSWGHDLLIVGASPVLPSGIPAFGWSESIGLLRDHLLKEWGSGQWAACRECGQPAIYHTTGSWECRPCGHHDGDSLIAPPRLPVLELAWANATNEVKWRGGRV